MPVDVMATQDESRVASLEQENGALKSELARLRQQLQLQQGAQQPQHQQQHGPAACSIGEEQHAAEAATQQAACVAAWPGTFEVEHGLSKLQVERYSRQLLLPSFGLEAQEALCKASVLIVGCGGLGSPAALYLAASGIGRLGLVDHDVVELSNLHRQIIHTEARVGVHKAASAQAACLALNSGTQVQAHLEGLRAGSALNIVGGYDVVLDCSDNPATRYLVSDACVAAGKPLVSAAAVGTDGQLTVYNYGEDGPCYRCLFPEAPAPENCSRCSDAGVLGVVPGIMGSLQALEAIKIISRKGEVLSRKLLVFDALAGRFMTVKLRARSAACAMCGDSPSVTAQTLPTFDYVAFTGQEAQDGPPIPLNLLSNEQRLEPLQAKAALDKARASGQAVLLLDVRPELQFRLMHLPGAVNVPLEQLPGRMDEVLRLSVALSAAGAEEEGSMAGAEEEGSMAGSAPGPLTRVLVICRRGNVSQVAVQQLMQAGLRHAVDIVGGMTRWAADVDGALPVL